jgi:hypothetical protein
MMKREFDTDRSLAMTAFAKEFTVYGTFYGSDELPDAIAVFPTYLDAEIFIKGYHDTDPMVEYDFYLIEMTVGGLRFAAYA